MQCVICNLHGCIFLLCHINETTLSMQPCRDIFTNNSWGHPLVIDGLVRTAAVSVVTRICLHWKAPQIAEYTPVVPCAHRAAALGPDWRITNGPIIRNNTPEICKLWWRAAPRCRDTVMRSTFPDEARGLCSVIRPGPGARRRTGGDCRSRALSVR